MFDTENSASDCPTFPSRAQLMVDTNTYAALAADGVITVTVESSSSVSSTQCSNGSLVIQLELPELYNDCDDNGRNDSCDIDAGATDIDDDGRIDACEYATGDLNLDGSVGGADLAIMLSLWGAEDSTMGDLDNDGVVSAADLAMLLASWNSFG
jgi:hypothetical protein